MDKLGWITVVLVVVTLLVEIFLTILKNKVKNNLVELLISGQFEEFDKYAEKGIVKYFIPVYNLTVMKFNEALLKNEKTKVSEYLNEFKKMKMNEEQQMYVYAKAFYYFVDVKEFKNAKKCYNNITNLKDSKEKQYVMMVYNTMVENEAKYLDKALEIYSSVNGQEKSTLAILISQMYENKGEHDKALELIESLNIAK